MVSGITPGSSGAWQCRAASRSRSRRKSSAAKNSWLTAKSAVPGHAAVRVHDDLAAGEARVAHRSAGDEAPGRVDQQPDLRDVQIELVEFGLHDMLPDIRFEQPGQADVTRVLAGDHHGVQPDRGVALVFHRDLRLAVGPQVGQHVVLAQRGQPAREAVGQRDGQRHQFGRLAGRVAEHQALVPGALPVEVARRTAGPLLVGAVHALRDVGRLGADGHVDPTGAAVEALGGRVVADAEHHVANDPRDVHLCGGGHLAGHMDLAGRHQGLQRHA
ncbi:hypothetical protein QFZ43_005563 [Streptomyces afghaniensis]|nr:hypothetical protein [Streptomyces afghaniensis]